ncbi:MAG: NAD(P)H-hydrate dehydratase [Anaerolineaceae bacterium]|nr:NAD(P)H-hydrate dehydratase [Anaerolineaceae bacterium]
MAEVQRLISLPARAEDGNKGSFGCVTVVGGCENYLGAPILCGKAAYRVGCGLVELVVPEIVRNCGAPGFTEAVWDCKAFADGLVPERKNAVTVIGPGLGTAPEIAAKLPSLINSAAMFSKLIVLDADALNLLSRSPEWFETVPENCVLTPHPGEMARLCRMSVAEVQENRAKLALAKAAEWHHIILLKGAHTVIASPEGYYVVLPYVTSALSVAGSGDVLAGIIAGFAAQGKPAFDAAWLGGEVHARAGLLAADTFGNPYSVMAGDLLESLPKTITAYAKFS